MKTEPLLPAGVDTTVHISGTVNRLTVYCGIQSIHGFYVDFQINFGTVCRSAERGHIV